jgi:hypothetical protein
MLFGVPFGPDPEPLAVRATPPSPIGFRPNNGEAVDAPGDPAFTEGDFRFLHRPGELVSQCLAFHGKVDGQRLDL